MRHRRLTLAMVAVLAMVTGAACTLHGLRPDAEPAAWRVHLHGELERIGDRAVIEAARPHLDGGFFETDLDAVVAAVTELPWVSAASVHRRWPDNMVIRVTEHEPAALWGEHAVLARSGAIFRPQTRPSGLPRLHGPDGSAKRLLAELPAMREALAGTGRTIERLTIDKRGAWRLRTADDLELRLGRDNVEARLRRFTEHGDRVLENQLERAAYVDLRYTDGFAVGGLRQPNTGETNDEAT